MFCSRLLKITKQTNTKQTNQQTSHTNIYICKKSVLYHIGLFKRFNANILEKPSIICNSLY